MHNDPPVKSQTCKVIAACIVVPLVFSIISLSLIFPCALGPPTACRAPPAPITESDCVEIQNGNDTILTCKPIEANKTTTTQLMTTSVEEMELKYRGIEGEIKNLLEFIGQVDIFNGDTLVFSGHLQNGEKTGHGTKYATSGEILYEGNWISDSYHGDGKLFDNGHLTYDGKFKNGFQQGTGSLFDRNGEVLFNGVFDCYSEDGHDCVIVTNDGYKTANYQGGFKNNKPHGFGKMKEDDETYQGEFKEGVKQGQGKLFKNGVLKYEGGFENDELSGFGVFHYGNGMRYEGDFENNLRHGTGVEYYFEDSVRYNGDWKNGLYDGIGQYFDQNKSYYQGSFKAGKFHGIGQVRQGNVTIAGVWDDNDYVGRDRALVGQIGFNWVKMGSMSF